ncbi:MAG: tetratricopeptide repeat protein [Flavobacteriaceae bacterium]|nr:tetratricopeptide repeat protein [Flavobacteriaceae bacterium]
MKKVVILLYIFFATTFLCAQQNSVIDSLLTVVKISSNDTIKANAHYELGWVLKQSDLPSAFIHMDSAMTLYENLNLPRKVALSHFQYSVLYRISGEYKKAIKNINAYQEYVESVKDTANLIFSHFEKGVIYSKMGDYSLGLKEFYKAYNSAENTKNWHMLGNVSNSIGIVYTDLEKYDDAINTLKETIKIYEDNSVDGVDLADVYNSLGSPYKERRDFDKARQYFDKALQIYKENENGYGVSITNLNKAITYNEEKEYNKALPLLEKAYQIQKENDFEAELIMTLSSLGETHNALGNLVKSEAYLKEGLKLRTQNKQSARDLYLELYRVNEKKSNYKKALNFHQTYVAYKDSIFDEEKMKSVNRLQQQFETAKKDKEIAAQQLALNEQEAEIQEKKTQTNYLLGAIGFLSAVSLLLVFLFKQRQERKNQELLTLKREFQIQTLESLIEGEEKERMRIAKDLHDGVNGDLAVIKYKLSSLLEMNNSIIDEAITMIDDSCQQVRAISHNLIPPSLESFDLIEATREHCARLNDVTPETAITFQFLGDKIDLPKKTEANVFRIIQELVANAISHAEASEIDVQISSRDNTIQITVEDNGKGFDKNNVESDGIGLSNVQSRADYLNADIDFISNEKGTSYTINIDKK